MFVRRLSRGYAGIDNFKEIYFKILSVHMFSLLKLIHLRTDHVNSNFLPPCTTPTLQPHFKSHLSPLLDSHPPPRQEISLSPKTGDQAPEVSSPKSSHVEMHFNQRVSVSRTHLSNVIFLVFSQFLMLPQYSGRKMGTFRTIVIGCLKTIQFTYKVL